MAKTPATPAAAVSEAAAAETARRIAAIAGAVSQGITQAVNEAAEREDLNKQADDLKTGSNNKRLAIMGKLAEFADAEDWLEGEIAEGVATAVKSRNFKLPSSANVFVSEMKTSMHPNVRGVLSSIVETCDNAWNTEKAAREADKSAPTPCMNAFARQYHMTITVMREAAKGLRYPAVDQLQAFAQRLLDEKAQDAEKAYKKFTKIREQLLEFNNNFNVPDLIAAHDTLKEITYVQFENGMKNKREAPDGEAGEGDETINTSQVAPTVKGKKRKNNSAAMAATVTPPTATPPADGELPLSMEDIERQLNASAATNVIAGSTVEGSEGEGEGEGGDAEAA